MALKRAEAAYRRRQAAIAASKSSGGRVNIREEDLWTVQVRGCAVWWTKRESNRLFTCKARALDEP